MLLLRRTIAALHRGGYEVTLLAPGYAASVLVGPGPSEVRHVVDWERADVAPLVAGERDLPESLRQELHGCDVAFVYTRQEGLLAGLRTLVPRVIARDPTPPAGSWAADWLAGAAGALGLEVHAAPSCVTTADEAAAAEPWLARLPAGFLALHPGSGSPRKNWPAERFLAVAARLRPEGPWFIGLGPADARLAATFRADARCVIAEALPVRVLGAVLARAGVYVGNDCGVSHLAAAWGARTVALFGPTDARVWAPDGEDVRTVQSRTGDITDVGVDEVAAAALR